MAKNSPKTGPGLALSLSICAIGFVLGIVGTVVAFLAITGAQSSDTHPLPGALERQLDTGTYDIYAEALDFADLLDEDSLDEFVSVGAITVRDPSGQELLVGPSDPELVTNRGFTFYEHIGSFEAADDGLYVIDVESEAATTIVVGERFSTAWRDALWWAVASVIGSLLFIVGVVMLVVGIVRRQRAKKSEPPAWTGQGGAPPPIAPAPHTAPPHTAAPTTAAPVAPSAAPPSTPWQQPTNSPPPPPPSPNQPRSSG